MCEYMNYEEEKKRYVSFCGLTAGFAIGSPARFDTLFNLPWTWWRSMDSGSG